MKTLLLVGASALALVSLSACNTLGTSLTAPGGADQVVKNLKAFNDAAANGPCVGYGNIDWQPPLPPSGALHVQCFVGNPQVMTLRQLGATAPVPAPAAVAPADPAAPKPQ
jgi:hypothetical protein